MLSSQQVERARRANNTVAPVVLHVTVIPVVVVIENDRQSGDHVLLKIDGQVFKTVKFCRNPVKRLSDRSIVARPMRRSKAGTGPVNSFEPSRSVFRYRNPEKASSGSSPVILLLPILR